MGRGCDYVWTDYRIGSDGAFAEISYLGISLRGLSGFMSLVGPDLLYLGEADGANQLPRNYLPNGTRERLLFFKKK